MLTAGGGDCGFEERTVVTAAPVPMMKSNPKTTIPRRCFTITFSQEVNVPPIDKRRTHHPCLPQELRITRDYLQIRRTSIGESSAGEGLVQGQRKTLPKKWMKSSLE